MNRWRLSFAGLVFAGVLALAGCGGPVVTQSDRAFLADTDLFHRRVETLDVDRKNPRVQRYLEQLMLRIANTAKDLDGQGQIRPASGEAPSPWSFTNEIQAILLDYSMPSCFTTGGRRIYITNGLFQQCRSEDELAALLCHQYVHLYARHIQRMIKREDGPRDDAGVLGPLVSVRLTSVQEREAGRIAYAIYTRGGWDPTRFATLYGRLAQSSFSTDVVDRLAASQNVEEARKNTEALPDASRDWAQAPVADESRFAQVQAELKNIAGAPAPGSTPDLLLTAMGSCLRPGETPMQIAARTRLFPAAPASNHNQWDKGLGGK